MTIAESLKQEGREEGREEGRVAGHEAGLQEGRLENQIETAKSLFEKGFSLDLIRSVTKLPDQALKEMFPSL